MVTRWSPAHSLTFSQTQSGETHKRESENTGNSDSRLFLNKTVPEINMKEKRSYLSSCVGADIHPGLSSIEPEDACGPFGVVGQEEWDRPIKAHRGIQVVLVNIHVVEPIWIPIPETGEQTLSLSHLNAGKHILTLCGKQPLLLTLLS